MMVRLNVIEIRGEVPVQQDEVIALNLLDDIRHMSRAPA